MDEGQLLLDELDDLITGLEDDLGRPLTEDEIDEVTDYVFDDDEEEEDEDADQAQETAV